VWSMEYLLAGSACTADSEQQCRLTTCRHTPGLDSAELISQLRAAHAADSATASGVDVITGGVGDMGKLGIFESFRVRARPAVAAARTPAAPGPACAPVLAHTLQDACPGPAMQKQARHVSVACA
jgi:hypothetical protein